MHITKINRYLLLDDYNSNIYELIKFIRINKVFHIYLNYIDFVERIFNDYQYIIDNKFAIILNRSVLSKYKIGQKYIYEDEIRVTFLGCLFIKREIGMYKGYVFNDILCLFAVHNDIPNNYLITDLVQCNNKVKEIVN